MTPFRHFSPPHAPASWCQDMPSRVNSRHPGATWQTASCRQAMPTNVSERHHSATWPSARKRSDVSVSKPSGWRHRCGSESRPRFFAVPTLRVRTHSDWLMLTGMRALVPTLRVGTHVCDAPRRGLFFRGTGRTVSRRTSPCKSVRTRKRVFIPIESAKAFILMKFSSSAGFFSFMKFSKIAIICHFHS